MNEENNEILENIYTIRNLSEKSLNKRVSLFEKERGDLFATWIGIGKRVLDLGCKYGALTEYYIKDNDVTGFDIDSKALKMCSEGIKTEQHDLNGDWHKNNEDKFDVVVSSEVVEHLYYPDEVMKKINFVLKSGGYFIGSVPNAFNLKNRFRLFFANKNSTPLVEPTHINHFSYQELSELLNKYFVDVELVPIVQDKWKWFAKIFPGLGSFLLAFKARKK